MAGAKALHDEIAVDAVFLLRRHLAEGGTLAIPRTVFRPVCSLRSHDFVRRSRVAPSRRAPGVQAVGIGPFPALVASRAPSSRPTVQRPRHPGALALDAVPVGGERGVLAERADALAESSGHGGHPRRYGSRCVAAVRAALLAAMAGSSTFRQNCGRLSRERSAMNLSFSKYGSGGRRLNTWATSSYTRRALPRDRRPERFRGQRSVPGDWCGLGGFGGVNPGPADERFQRVGVAPDLGGGSTGRRSPSNTSRHNARRSSPALRTRSRPPRPRRRAAGPAPTAQPVPPQPAA